LSDSSDKKMKLETAIVVTAATVLILLFVAFLLARLRPAPVKETYAPNKLDATTVLKKVLHQTPDAAEFTDEEVTTYIGGASSRSVTLEVVEDSMPLTAADITGGTVRFVGDGSYDVVKMGALIHDEFELTPILKGTPDVIGYKGRDARKFLQARHLVLHKLSRFRYVRVRSPNETLKSHDLSQASVPVVPEICKHAPLQAVSLTFETIATGTGGVSVFIVPRKKDMPPAAFHVRFYGNDVLIKYHVLKAAVGLEPNAIVTMSAAANSRSGGEIFLLGARTGTDNVKVYAELTKGHVRVCTEETVRKRSYYLKLPLMFSEDNVFLSDSIDPPTMFTRTYDVEQPLILPFAVGDLTAFDRVQGSITKRAIQPPPYKPTGTPAPTEPIGKGVASGSFVPGLGSFDELFNGGMARSKTGMYATNGGYVGHNETRTKSGAVVRGEWVQYSLKRPHAFRKLKYAVGNADVPKRVVVLGSNNDGWTQIAVENGTPRPYTDITIPLNGTYQQYRVVITDTAEEVKMMAKEGQTFDFVGSVKYGSSDKWTSKVSQGSGQCTDKWFGRDPAPGTKKECQAHNGIIQQGTLALAKMSFS
jgi:hypothetical protein